MHPKTTEQECEGKPTGKGDGGIVGGSMVVPGIRERVYVLQVLRSLLSYVP